jgi:hypothetical protein
MELIKNKLLVSGAGLASVEFVHMVVPSPEFIGEIGKLVIQLAIGIVTMIRLIKEGKKMK